jgi:hypothetical protein
MWLAREYPLNTARTAKQQLTILECRHDGTTSIPNSAVHRAQCGRHNGPMMLKFGPLTGSPRLIDFPRQAAGLAICCR